MKKVHFTSFWGLTILLTTGTMTMTSCSFTGTTDAIFNFTSSSTNWYFPGWQQEQHQIQVFSAANFSRLKEDMAAGQGPYLTSLATLMKIPQGQRQDFYNLTKSNFHSLVPSDQTTSQEMLANLSLKLSGKGPDGKVGKGSAG